MGHQQHWEEGWQGTDFHRIILGMERYILISERAVVQMVDHNSPMILPGQVIIPYSPMLLVNRKVKLFEGMLRRKIMMPEPIFSKIIRIITST